MKRAAFQVHDLPASARELVDIMGLSATLALIEHWGGTRVHVPTSVRDDHPLARRLGRRAARALADRMGGDNLDVPRAARALRAALYTQIYRDYTGAAGGRPKTAAQLAREHRCTERWIYEVVARYRVADTAPAPQQALL